MKKLFLLLILTQINCTNLPQKDFFLKEGDLLFQDLDSSPICRAIEYLTPGYNNGNFSHVGMVIEVGDSNCIDTNYRYNDNVRVIEAFPGGVKEISIDSFLNRSLDDNNNPKVIVGRLKKQYQYVIKNGVKSAKNLIAKSYDEIFIINNDSYYCSELIYEAFKKDNIFTLSPMNFLDPITKEPLQEWEEYYRNIEEVIPQNQPGINPGAMSISDKIGIVHIYGIPDGMQKNNH